MNHTVQIEDVEMMEETLESVGFEFERLADGTYQWTNELAESAFLPTRIAAIMDAWESAAEYVRDVLRHRLTPGQWKSMWDHLSLYQQCRLIDACFTDDSDDETMLSVVFVQSIIEAERLRSHLRAVGTAIESDEIASAKHAWAQARADLFIS